MKRTGQVIFLIFIVLIAFFLRFYRLGHNPPSLTWDEAAWGYNAYSLGIDGRDEFGRLLPYDYLESFGDFKPPMYAYLDVLPVKIFGLTEFSTRFPSAFFGTLTVLVTFFLTKEIFKESKHKNWYSLTSAVILAISPWHIMLSRAAFEANIATFFLVTGVWLFLVAVDKKSWYLCLSIFSFILSIYSFNSARIVAPLLVFTLVVFFRRNLLKNKTQSICALLLGLLLIFPIIRFLASPQARLRFQEVNIFSDISVIKTSNQEIANDNNSLISKIIHNRRWLYGLSFFRHYFDNLNPDFLFIKGDGNPKFSTQDVGELYLWDLPFFIAGIFLLIKKKEGSWIIIPIWLLLGIIPAATARETPHALRIEATLPTFQILVAYGIVHLISKINIQVLNATLRKTIYSVIILLLLCNTAYFLHGYYVHYSQEYSGEWQYGYNDAIGYVQSVQQNYDEIHMTQALGRPYIYFAFYLKADPKFLRKTEIIQRDSFGFVTIEGFGKYKFPVNMHMEPKSNKKVLYIDIPSEVPRNANMIQTFYLLNGNPALVAYTL